MNTLNQTTPVQATPAHPGTCPAMSGGILLKLVGQIHDMVPDGATHLQARLTTSLGTWPLRVSASLLEPGLQDGDWVCAKLRTDHARPRTLLALRLTKVAPAPGQTAWLPKAACNREAGMAELRRILFRLEPALQAFFADAMTDAAGTESHFFRKLAALDHHCYPGGLFDQSLAAARLAQQDPEIQERDRGLLTLAALLFDLGKASQEAIAWDSDRVQAELQPHPLTAQRLMRPLQRLAKSHPTLAADLAALMADEPASPSSPRMELLQSRLRQCVEASWGDTGLLAIPHNRTGAAQ